MGLKQNLDLFKELLEKYRYDYEKLVYVIFPFGQPGHALEHMKPYAWQLRIWKRMSDHFKNPATRDLPFKLNISSGNGIGKSAFFSITLLMLMYTQRVRGKITANTYSQIKNITWVEIENWCIHARFFDVFFEKLGETIKSKDEEFQEIWKVELATWDTTSPAGVSGLHNKGHCVFWGFDEAAGIPAIIWKYANGAMTDVGTMKIWIAIGNSDDPESQFEQNMYNPQWIAERIDSRTVEAVSKNFIQGVLDECGGNEDADDFRVRVRGLPRKSSADAIINSALVENALNSVLDLDSQIALPCVMTADLAWTGGDYCAIWIHQGYVSILVDLYKLDKTQGENHVYTFQRMCMWEKKYSVDYTLIDQAEGTAVFSLAQAAHKWTWELVSFASSPNDTPEFKDSQYQNMRAQMYYEAAKHLQRGAAIQVLNPDWKDQVRKQLSWTKGIRNKTSLKKQAESKILIKERVGQSPDVADGYVLRFSRIFYDRQEHNMVKNEREVYEVQEGLEYDPYKDL